MMGKKVKVTTKCGGTFFYDHDQEVETVEVVERIDHIWTTLKKIAKALNEFVENHHEWFTDVYAVEHDKKTRVGIRQQPKALLITLEQHSLDEIMLLIKEAS